MSLFRTWRIHPSIKGRGFVKIWMDTGWWCDYFQKLLIHPSIHTSIKHTRYTTYDIGILGIWRVIMRISELTLFPFWKLPNSWTLPIWPMAAKRPLISMTSASCKFAFQYANRYYLFINRSLIQLFFLFGTIAMLSMTNASPLRSPVTLLAMSSRATFSASLASNDKAGFSYEAGCSLPHSCPPSPFQGPLLLPPTPHWWASPQICPWLHRRFRPCRPLPCYHQAGWAGNPLALPTLPSPSALVPSVPTTSASCS